ncbi:hypothetical protein AB9F45_36785, partial [Rhizobium leguminosarum]|uniref:hypothetical protein n=1 Tax=Rhizobium leguminosarum TaxID=384 RepID=UPI003F979A9B
AFGVWKAMGKPQNPAGEDYARLEASGKLSEIDGQTSVKVDDGKIALRVSLPRQFDVEQGIVANLA